MAQAAVLPLLQPVIASPPSPPPQYEAGVNIPETLTAIAGTWSQRGEKTRDSEYPLTRIQAAEVRRARHAAAGSCPSARAGWITLALNLPWDPFFSVDRVRYTWQAVATHNPVLRTVLVRTGDDAEAAYQHRVLASAAPLRFQFAYESETEGRPPYAVLEVDEMLQSSAVSFRIARVLVDETSLALLRLDFALFYNGLAFSSRAPFPAYVRHLQRGAGPAGSKALHARELQADEYWRASLAGVVDAPIFTSVPTRKDLPRRFVSRALDRAVFHRLRDVLASYDVSAPSVFQALWAALLAQHAGSAKHEVVFGVVGRDESAPGHQSVVGRADMVFPLRITFTGTTSIIDLVRIVDQVRKEASAHAWIGYDSITKASPGLALQSIFSYVDGMECECYEQNGEPFQLAVRVTTVHESVNIGIGHNPGIPESKIQVLLDHYTAALESMVHNATTVVDEVDLVSREERTFLLKHGQPTTLPQRGVVTKLLEEQVQRTPDSPAVQFETERPLSYDELNRRANRLARVLRSHGAAAGRYIPVCMDRSAEYIVSVLAIIKSGAAYVPLDPETPMERTLFIVGDVSPPFVLSHKKYVDRFSSAIAVEDLMAESASSEDTNLAIGQDPSDIIYVIYTSGSTGKPKGVLLEHAAAYSGLVAFPKLENLRQLLFHNPVFSAAQRSIFSTLKQGGCLCMARKENLTINLGDTINKMQINVVDVTPSTASLIKPGTVPSLRRMTVAGELINPALLPLWSRELELLNAYGLSECTQINWRRVMEPTQNPQNIGRPSDTTSSYVLVPDSTRLAPLLVPGELCLGGHQLGRMYLNRPEKTAEAFIQNPFGPGRLYRTGDMAIAHEDGSIEIVGRIDFQVKINGQRVEPGEPNAILQKHAKVRASWVVTATVGERKALVACIVLEPTATWEGTDTELRSLVQSQLPLYMVPSFWLPMEKLPLNVNGKVDVPTLTRQVEALGREGLMMRASSKPQTNGHAGPEEAEATPMEQQLRKLVAEVLEMGVDEVELDDSLLSLGGSSLEAITIVSRARTVGLGIELTDLLQAGSLRELAEKVSAVSEAGGVEARSADPEPFALLDDEKKGQLSKRDDIEDAYPATPLQEAVMADSVQNKGGYVYQRAFTVKNVSGTALRDAFAAAVANDPVMRTVFATTNTQLVKSTAHFELPWAESDAETVEEYMAADRAKPMGLEDALVRGAFVPRASAVVVTVHHALYDFWSRSWLYDDASAFLRGNALVQRPKFSRFIKHISTIDTAPAEAFWKEYLSGAAPTLLALPGEHATIRAVDTPSALVTGDIKSFGAGHGLTLGGLVYTAWALVLSVHARNSDVSFATSFSGRDAPVEGITSISGPTVATVPQRVYIDPAASLLDVARHVQDGLYKLAPHASHGMRRALQAGGQSGSALFDTMVNFRIREKVEDTEERIFVPLAEPPNVNEFVTLEAEDAPDGLHLRVITTALDAKRTRYIVAQVQKALETLMQQPQISAASLDLVTEDERTHLIALSASSSPAPTLAHAGLEQAALRNPGKVAIQYRGITDAEIQSMSYAEFNAQANRIASFLREKGVGPEDIVPVCMDKSVETLMVEFAIMKAGGAFVPLGPENPPERNNFIVSDVKPKLIMTESAYSEVFLESGVECVQMDDMDFSAYPAENVPVAGLTPESLVYIIYTSGSTGMPKGVLVSHAAVSASAQSMIKATGVTEDWKVLWFLNYVFDASYYDIFTVLGAGGTICIVPTEDMLSDLAGCVNSMEVTELMVTPTVAKLIHPDDVPGLKKLLVCGEPLTSNLADLWAARMPMYNCYGPTEATILMTICEVKAGKNSKNIGYPLETCAASIRSTEGTGLVPFGAIGELCVSGPQLARGYLNRPEATSAAFILDGFGEKMYRTGDLARWLGDGQIECLGRKDSQIKLNGFRIELGEIENAIIATGKVRDAVSSLVTIQDKSHLAAFVIFDGAAGPDQTILPPEVHADDVTQLSTSLTTLTHYMVPHFWFPVTSFPLMPSGKANRKMLVSWVEKMDHGAVGDYSLAGERTEFVDAETDEERLLQKVWGKLFGIDPATISVTATFFFYGGDSISAINLVASLRSEGWVLAVKDVLAQPRLRDMATRIKPIGQDLVKVEQFRFDIPEGVFGQVKDAGLSDAEVEEVYPCAPGQVEFLNQEARNDQFWMLMTVRPIPQDIDMDRWVDLTTQLTAHNQILRSTYLRYRGTWYTVVLKSPVPELEIIHCHVEDKQRLVDETFSARIPTGKPWVRYRLLVYPDGTRDLVTKLDHAMYDGTSLRIFDDQFKALAKNKPIPRPVPFRDFVAYNAAADRTKTLAFWQDLLHNSAFTFPDAPRPKVSGVVWGKTDSRVDAFANQCGVTVSVVFQTAYTLLLARRAGRASRRDSDVDVTYDNLLTGRNVDMDDPQAIAGTCANFLPFRSAFAPASTSVRALLKDTQDRFWKTTEHGTVGLSDIYDGLGIPRSQFLFCFQPFDPPSGLHNHLRWVVMALSKPTMFVNYVVMFEVFKDARGYKLKWQYDGSVYSKVQAEDMVTELVGIVESMMGASRGLVKALL